MAAIIDHQNRDLLAWTGRRDTQRVNNNRELCRALGIQEPPAEYEQFYSMSDVRVEVLKRKGNEKVFCSSNHGCVCRSIGHGFRTT